MTNLRRRLSGFSGIFPLTVLYLVGWIAWNLATLALFHTEGDLTSFPNPKYRSGLSDYVSAPSYRDFDFVVYEAMKQRFQGGHLIGFDQRAVAFGQIGFNPPFSFNALSRTTIANYDPTLTEAETRSLIERAAVRRRRV